MKRGHCTTRWLPKGNQTETNKYIVLNKVVCEILSHLSMPLVPVPCEVSYIPRYSGSDWRPNTFPASSSSSDHQCQGVNIVIFSTQHLCRCAVHMKYKDLVEFLPDPSVHEDCSLGSHYSMVNPFRRMRALRLNGRVAGESEDCHLTSIRYRKVMGIRDIIPCKV